MLTLLLPGVFFTAVATFFVATDFGVAGTTTGATPATRSERFGLVGGGVTATTSRFADKFFLADDAAPARVDLPLIVL